MSKVELAVVKKNGVGKKAHVHHKPKVKEESNPQWELFLNSWMRLCLTLLGCITFCFEFIASGFEGACRNGLKLMQGKEKKIG